MYKVFEYSIAVSTNCSKGVLIYFSLAIQPSMLSIMLALLMQAYHQTPLESAYTFHIY